MAGEQERGLAGGNALGAHLGSCQPATHQPRVRKVTSLESSSVRWVQSQQPRWAAESFSNNIATRSIWNTMGAQPTLRTNMLPSKN